MQKNLHKLDWRRRRSIRREEDGEVTDLDDGEDDSSSSDSSLRIYANLGDGYELKDNVWTTRGLEYELKDVLCGPHDC